ncbi:metalloregulator ArsR/SmtB family transcription factor [Acidisoma sp. L85]|uniref:ArsR/SmtB family transcription factor n=1 Tax=Acidisoma sp. L85 TaxID=1641850 RepID=UPI00131BA482
MIVSAFAGVCYLRRNKRFVTREAGNLTLFASTLKALGHPLRFSATCHLLDGERSVGELLELLNASQPNFSQQMVSLKRAGIVETRRDAGRVFYQICRSDAGTLASKICRPWRGWFGK